MALASGPRFALVIGGYWIMRDGLAKRSRGQLVNRIALAVGIIRTVRAPPAREPTAKGALQTLTLW